MGTIRSGSNWPVERSNALRERQVVAPARVSGCRSAAAQAIPGWRGVRLARSSRRSCRGFVRQTPPVALVDSGHSPSPLETTRLPCPPSRVRRWLDPQPSSSSNDPCSRIGRRPTTRSLWDPWGRWRCTVRDEQDRSPSKERSSRCNAAVTRTRRGLSTSRRRSDGSSVFRSLRCDSNPNARVGRSRKEPVQREPCAPCRTSAAVVYLRFHDLVLEANSIIRTFSSRQRRCAAHSRRRRRM